RLRFDPKDGPSRARDGGAATAPGTGAESELVRRITAEDADERMPPTKANRQLTAKQIDTLKRWVDEGAKWGQPWALTPLKKPQVPGPPSSVLRPVDAFIQDRLAQEGLKSSPEATREGWLRVVSPDP